MDSVWLKLFCSFLLKPMRSQIPTPQVMTSHLTAHISELTGACVPPCVPLVTKSLAWPGGWRTLATSCARLDRAAQPSVSLTSLILGPAHRPAESPEPELCPGSSPPPPPSLSIPDTKPLWSPGPLTRPRQAVQAHLVYLHLNHQYTDLHLNAFSQRPVASQITSTPQATNSFLTASVWSEGTFYSRLSQSWLELGIAILTTQIRPAEAQYKWWRMRIRRASMIALIYRRTERMKVQ